MLTPDWIKAVADEVTRRVAELPGRSSPEDCPEMMLVTDAELRCIVREVIETL